MKVAFIGTHGTGKTTLVHKLISALKEQSYDADFRGEMTNKCPFPINEGTTEDAQNWLFHALALEEMTLKSKCDILVCDRSLLDNYVYSYNAFGEDKTKEAFVEDYMKSYDLLFRVPLSNGKLTENKIRSVDINWQREIEGSFNHLIKKLNIPIQEYESLNRVIDLVKIYKKKNG